jgi:hypothetical protein
MIKIIPKEGLKVINPDTMKRVPKYGIVIPKITTYWKNRLKDKDITIEDLSKKKSSNQVSKKIEEKK